MRSKLLVCAAIAAVGSSHWFAVAHAADGKDAKNKTKPTELHADDKSMKKQTQWEDKVMGPDNKRAELDKIARARAITAKAEKDKEKQAAFEASAPAPKAAPGRRQGNEKSEVNLLSDAQDKPDTGRSREISPKLETAEAQAPSKPVKPADDKFIDKLLRDEDAPSKRHASSANDKELESLLAGAKEPKPAGHKRGDSVDDLIKSADKGPAMPAPRAQSGLPDWAKQPEIAPSPAAPPPPIALRTAPKRNENSGVIQVVQGAAGNGPAIVTPSRSAPVVAARPGRNGKTTVSKTSAQPQRAQPPVVWNDPFAEKRPAASAPTPRKEPASRPSASTDSSWNDPFAEQSEPRKTVRHNGATQPVPASAPKRRDTDKADPSARPAAHPYGWKDPFTKAAPEPARAQVAMRELGKGESSKWEIAARRPATRASASDSHTGAWGVLKKRAR